VRLSWLWSPPDSVSEDSPSTMKGNEALLGLAVAGIIIAVAVLDLTVTTGAGAPKHPETWAPVVGIVLAVALIASLRFRNRLASPFVAIFAAYFVELAKTPKSISTAHVIALAAAVGFAVALTLRHRSAQKAAGTMTGPAQRRAAADARRRRRKGEPEPEATMKRPPASARYTPPKSAIPPKSGSSGRATRSGAKPKR
jgi:hypothetical protein